ncbi:MAG TPA: site-2 protease family protein [Verrucomicrobiae bacterium]|jgi:Zn-dependent protease|nr:site-2 protease family protein [Verrucomicrobiae bacterium]
MTDFFSDPTGFLIRFVLQLPALLLAVTIHELAHGLVADRLGDPTARLSGRLTLNPLPHIDPLGALALILVGFGWAKPVPVNAYNLRHPVRDMAAVAAAGPLANFVVAFMGLLLYRLLVPMTALPFVVEPVRNVMAMVFILNVGLGVFNLIPLPPLDGGHFLPYFFPRASWGAIHKLEQYGPIILILAVMSGATRYVVGPAIAFVQSLLIALASLIV